MKVIPRQLGMVLALVLIAVVGATGSHLPAASANPAGDVPQGSITISLLDIPADRVDDPRAQSYIVDNIPPGQSIERRVKVTNNTGARAALDMYAGPAEITDGTFTPKPRGDTNPLVSWVTLSHSEVELDHGQSADVLVTITVPADAPEVEQYGAIWVSTKEPGADTGEQIRQVSRVGVRMYVSAGEGNGPPSDFHIDSLVPQRDESGSAIVAAEVTNVGGRAVDLAGELDLGTGPGGLTATAVNSETVTVAPGGHERVLFAIPDSVGFPAGPWPATATINSGWIEHSISADITFPDAGEGEPVEGRGGVPLTVWAAILVALAVAASAAYFLLRRRQATSSPESGVSGPESP